jgi:hypothetical protein
VIPQTRAFERRYAGLVVLAAAVLIVSGAGAVGAPGRLVDHGGRVLSNPQVSAIYLGDYWATRQGASDALHTDTFLQTWLAGASMTDVLAQYGVGAGSFAGSDKVPGGAPAPFTDADAQALVQQEIAARRVVAGDQTIHVVYLPPGTVLTFQGATSHGRLGAYHSSYRDAVTGKAVYYAVVVYSQGANGVDLTGTPQDNISIMTSDALAGAMTDPDLGDVIRGALPSGTIGWRDDVNGDIGDLAFVLGTDPAFADVWAFQNGFAVELLWSNKDAKLTAGTTTVTGFIPTVRIGETTTTTSISLSLSPTTQTVAPGASGTYTVSNGTSDTLTLAVSGLPANVTGTLGQTVLTAGGTTALTLAVATGAATGSTTFTVTGTGGTSLQSTTGTLTVGTAAAATTATPAASTADFSLTATPSSQPIDAGGEVVTFTITSQPTGAANPRIKLQAQHLPHGIKAYISPSTIVAGDTATVTILAHQDPPRGSHDITIKGRSRTRNQRITITIVISRPR